MNFLEQLVAEWYAYKGFFVRTNIKFGKRDEGGYKGEMDVVVFDPKKRTLRHIEISSDADSWAEREKKFRTKFQAANEYYESEFSFQFEEIKRVAIVGFSRHKNVDLSVKLPDCDEHLSIPELLREIANQLKHTHPMKAAVPEVYPLIRAIQFAVWYGEDNAE